MMTDVTTFFETASLQRDAIIAVIGLCVGSFLNVLALRSLQERNILWPPSSCMKCNHRLGIADLVPVLSWLALKGKCRYCSEPIAWHYPVVEAITALAFVVVVRYFGFNFEGIGMLIFVSVLIAVCITDFKEKLIPHEITYPAILLGIGYSAMCSTMVADHHVMEHDFVMSMVGVGLSYILFDFIAFYGGMLYKWQHRNDELEDEDEESFEPTFSYGVPNEAVDTTYSAVEAAFMEEEVEVMGGGDAVLGAVIAAWLGLSRLGVALVVGFLIGTAMGAVYLAIELKKQNKLEQSYRPAIIGALLLLMFVEGMLGLFAYLGQNSADGVSFFSMPWWQFGTIAVLCGALLGIVRAGHTVSKPFPFGPALAGGAVVAMFYDAWTKFTN